VGVDVSVKPAIVAVTGATDGIGRAMARSLARDGAHVIVHGRSPERVQATVAEIVAETPGAQVHPYVADFASLANVREFGRALSADFPRIDVLINNAGLGGGPADRPRQVSADGYELVFAVNYLAPFLLTGLALPALRNAPAARIVNVASIGQAPLDYDDVMLERSYDGKRAYGQSKLALIGFTFELADRLRAHGIDNVTANALHPATLMPTKMVFESYGYTRSTLETGVDATLRLARDPSLEGVTGKFYDVTTEAPAKPQAYDRADRNRLWTLSEHLTAFSYESVLA
jgi:NAD(P)-dependent dehydrogenase (short-subunit alcohol dehydrogenase family)